MRFDAIEGFPQSGSVFTSSTDDRIRAFLAGEGVADRTEREPVGDGVVGIKIGDANRTAVNTVTLTGDQSMEIASRNPSEAGDRPRPSPKGYLGTA